MQASVRGSHLDAGALLRIVRGAPVCLREPRSANGRQPRTKSVRCVFCRRLDSEQRRLRFSSLISPDDFSRLEQLSARRRSTATAALSAIFEIFHLRRRCAHALMKTPYGTRANILGRDGERNRRCHKARRLSSLLTGQPGKLQAPVDRWHVPGQTPPPSCPSPLQRWTAGESFGDDGVAVRA